jgi:hypothetical protein
MTVAQWIMLGLGVAGFLLTWTGMAVGLTRFAESIKQDTSEKIAAEVLARTKAISALDAARSSEIEALRREFHEAQKAQDHNVGEMGAALRRFIETVEKEMHDIELWGRDHYVQKGEFEKATASIRSDIKEMCSELKSDIRERIDDLSKRMDVKN